MADNIHVRFNDSSKYYRMGRINNNNDAATVRLMLDSKPDARLSNNSNTYYTKNEGGEIGIMVTTSIDIKNYNHPYDGAYSTHG